MRLTDWGRLYGLNRISTWRMYNEGRLPPDLEVEKVGHILYVIVPEDKQLLTVGYARVSSSDRKHLLESQSSRLWKYAGENGIAMDRVVEEVASGLNDRRKLLLSLLSDPDVGWLVVEHRDRLSRFGVGMVDAMLKARGGGLIVVDETEVDDDPVSRYGAGSRSGYDRDNDVFLCSPLRSSVRSEPCQARTGGGR